MYTIHSGRFTLVNMYMKVNYDYGFVLLSKLLSYTFFNVFVACAISKTYVSRVLESLL